MEFDESEISENGAVLLKQALQDGECDKVSDHISELREDMHTEWLDTLKPEQMSSNPEWVMDKYFLTSGLLDQMKTDTVVGITLPQHNSRRQEDVRGCQQDQRATTIDGSRP